MRLIPDVPPITYTLSATIIGFLLIDDMTANEQNALGNWLMLVAQVLCTNAYYQQLEKERQHPNHEETIEMLSKMVKAMNQEINNLKRQ